ncbi:MAG: hypothetical protein CMG46_02570 [Candidatus Marinimicrobia bacterium]|nr:hypothetical protein [Candidatus Neomarinimicrobiota bacterium]|tara:strand:- start:18 stop:743 length:726 start_codon:yes stop_codon:yes gene_type:complete
MDKLEKLLEYEDHPNIILNSNAYLQKFYNTLKKRYTINTQTIDNGNIQYCKSLHHYEFDIDIIDNNIFFSLLNDIIKTKPFHRCYIVFNNMNNNCYNLQNKLKCFIERYYDYKYVIITKSYGNIINKLSASFISLYSKQIDDDRSLYKLIINKLFEIYLTPVFKIKDIKNFSYYIYACSIDFSLLLEMILDHIIHVKYSDKVINKVIQFFSSIEYKYKGSYNKIIFFEYILIELYRLLNNR